VERWRQLAVLSLAELLALCVWFSAAAVLPALRREWALGDAGSAALTIAGASRRPATSSKYSRPSR